MLASSLVPRPLLFILVHKASVNVSQRLDQQCNQVRLTPEFTLVYVFHPSDFLLVRINHNRKVADDAQLLWCVFGRVVARVVYVLQQAGNYALLKCKKNNRM
jgi:hypothetical protein